jgi:hypothetical protein
MDKREFRWRLERAGELARELGQQLVIEQLPLKLVYILPVFDDPRGARGPKGTIKYFGGRFLRPKDLGPLPALRAADLLWVDGKVPAWINVNAQSLDSEVTVIRMRCSHDLQVADEVRLERDLPAAVDPEDPIEPFRIRGPRMPPGWRSVREHGRISLLKDSVP